MRSSTGFPDSVKLNPSREPDSWPAGWFALEEVDVSGFFSPSCITFLVLMLPTSPVSMSIKTHPCSVAFFSPSTDSNWATVRFQAIPTRSVFSFLVAVWVVFPSAVESVEPGLLTTTSVFFTPASAAPALSVVPPVPAAVVRRF